MFRAGDSLVSALSACEGGVLPEQAREALFDQLIAESARCFARANVDRRFVPVNLRSLPSDEMVYLALTPRESDVLTAADVLSGRG
jgi:hypothetical protein